MYCTHGDIYQGAQSFSSSIQLIYMEHHDKTKQHFTLQNVFIFIIKKTNQQKSILSKNQQSNLKSFH